MRSMFFFFFSSRRRHTRYWRDWSSDVCSSDLGRYAGEPAVINYIIKNHDTGGYVSLSGEQNIGYNSGKYDIAGKTSNKKTSVSVYGGHNYSNYDGVTEYNNEQMFSDNLAIYRNATDTHSKYTFNQQYGQVKVSHDSKKHNI